MSDAPLADTRLALVGAGAMGEAMVAGLVDRRLVDAARVTCSHPRAERRASLESQHGVRVTADNVAAAREGDIVLLAVKPQMLAGVMAELRGSLRADQLVVSVVAGASTRALGEGLQHPAVVRTMPNTPAQIGQGVTVWYATESVDERRRDQVRAMLAALGREFEVHDERQVAMATAVSGTGPTYIFLFIEALTDAAVHLGFPRHVARELVLDTMSGLGGVRAAERQARRRAARHGDLAGRHLGRGAVRAGEGTAAHSGERRRLGGVRAHPRSSRPGWRAAIHGRSTAGLDRRSAPPPVRPVGRYSLSS